MADMNVKISGLKLLVKNGILSEEECERCIEAISGSANEIVPTVTGTVVPASGEYDYEDSKIAIRFKGIQRISNMFFGDGYSFKYIILNKTPYEIRVNVTEVTVNGFVVSNRELLCSEAASNKKTIDVICLYDSKMQDCDVYDTDDIEEFEFKIQYEIEDIDYEYESSIVSVVPYEA